MGKTVRFAGPCGIKASGAIRRVHNLSGRGAAAWRAHKELNNHAWAGHAATRKAAPRLVRRAQTQELQAITLEAFLATAPTSEVVEVSLPASDRLRVEVRRKAAEDVLAGILNEVRANG